MNVLFVPERIEEDPLFEHTFISEVECAMLWPDDELRERKQKEALPHVYKRLSDLGISFPVDVEREALDVALGSDSDKARAEEAMNSYRRGMLVGATLRDIVARFKIDGTRKTLGNSISPHTTGHGLVMSEETFLNNIWPKFRQVSHLWAAHLFLNEKLTKSDGNQEIFFPYSIEHRKLFMAYAYWYLEAGIGFTPRHSKRPLLNENEAWIFNVTPKDLPTVRMDFSNRAI